MPFHKFLAGNWVSAARLSLTSFKRSIRVHPRRLLKNVNISAGARNSGDKTLKYNARKRKKKQAKSYGETFAVRSRSLVVWSIDCSTFF